jgi:hypothetical protein
MKATIKYSDKEIECDEVQIHPYFIFTWKDFKDMKATYNKIFFRNFKKLGIKEIIIQ